MRTVASASRSPRRAFGPAGLLAPVLVPVLAGVLAGVLVLAGCGTREPDSAFATPSSSGPPGSGGAGNSASDTGVTADTVKVGVIVSKTSPLGPYTFSGSYYGATAFFDELNRAGGVH